MILDTVNVGQLGHLRLVAYSEIDGVAEQATNKIATKRAGKQSQAELRVRD